MSVQFKTVKRLAAVGGFLIAALTNPAQAQESPICGPEVKQEFAAVLDQAGYHKNPSSEESMQLKQELFEKYAFCVDDNQHDTPEKDAPRYCGELSFAADTAFERMRCCGYDPQKKQFACPIEVKLPYGFNAAHFPGSYEYVLSCVDFGGGFVPVARDRVHLADELYGNNPDWNFAVIANANDKLRSIPLQGQTLRARSILSWNTLPVSCSDTSIVWGNALDYQIRLDP